MQVKKQQLGVMGFPGGVSGKEPATTTGDIRDEGFIPGLGRCPGGENGNSLQCSPLDNPMDRSPVGSIGS